MSLWFTARGAGLSALILLSLSTCLGALMSRARGPMSAQAGPRSTLLRRAERRYLAQYVHRATAGLGLLVLALHVGTMIADSYAHVGLTGALIPFTSGYRPTPVALGTVSLYCLLGVSVLGLARGRMAASARAARVWRGLHGLAYLGWGTAMLHGFTSGTDSSLLWVRLLYLGCLAAVLACAWVRFVDRPVPDPNPAPPHETPRPMEATR